MGNRFIWSRYFRGGLSDRRWLLRLNESDYEPHRMSPCGLRLGGFSYRSVFDERRSKQQDRPSKKAARRAGRRWLQEQAESEVCYGK